MAELRISLPPSHRHATREIYIYIYTPPLSRGRLSLPPSRALRRRKGWPDLAPISAISIPPTIGRRAEAQGVELSRVSPCRLRAVWRAQIAQRRWMLAWGGGVEIQMAKSLLATLARYRTPLEHRHGISAGDKRQRGDYRQGEGGVESWGHFESGGCLGVSVPARPESPFRGFCIL